MAYRLHAVMDSEAWLYHLFERHFLQRKPEKQIRQVNMAAIPKALVESTLFGHLKGLFTGAIQNRKGLENL